MAEHPKKNRYPGIRAFETNEQDLFFGRNKEIRDLYHKVKVERLTVLFAKSGIGKTSLIHAGLIPRLLKHNFYPIHIRFQNTKYTPLQQLENTLKNKINSAKLAEFGGGNTFWDWVKASDFGEDTIPVFIFDQFEEFFSHEKSN